MRTLSIRQPWAWLICNGHKPVENRDWSTDFRGRFLIHASSQLVQRDFWVIVKDLKDQLGIDVPHFLELPRGDVLRLEANKTGKEADFDISLSQVLPGLLARRRALGADHLMLLSTPDGKPVNLTMLRYRWDIARHAAACKTIAAAGLVLDGSDDQADAYALADQIRAMYLRDMRKRAAQIAPDLRSASQLLQHDNEAFTQQHYGGVAKLKPVR